MTLSRWGDVVENCTTTPCGAPDGRVDVVTDIVALINKFGSSPGAPVKARADLEPSTVDQKINIRKAALPIRHRGGARRVPGIAVSV